jgi:four helix bundle protein
MAMRDHRKLRAFELADALALRAYQVTSTFPRQECFGLTSQLRRAAVSVPSNLVEGCTRESQADYLRFIEISHGSAQELAYQLSLASRLGFMSAAEARPVVAAAEEVCRVVGSLAKAVRVSLRNH